MPPVRLAAAAVLAASLALTVVISLFAAVSRIVPHTETLESIWWLAAFGIVTPATVTLTERLLISAQKPGGERRLTAAAPGGLLVLCASLFAARVAGSPDWSLFIVPAVPLLLLAGRRRNLVAGTWRMSPGRARVLAAVALASAGSLGVAAFLPNATRDPAVIARAAALLIAAAAVAAALRRHAPGSRLRMALGILIPLALALLAWDVSFQALTNHQDFYLGPANDIRHGRYMLVDDYSQYGVAVIYFLAGVMAPLPFGFGTFVLILGILTAVTIVSVYTVLRVATRSLVFASVGTFAALMASSIATVARITQYPSAGFLRFGVPWLLVCALTLAYRGDRPARGPLLAAYAIVGLATVWSFETAFYTIATFVVCVIFAAATQAEPRRARAALRHLAAGLAAALIAIVVLVTATIVGRGAAPHVSTYAEFLGLYSVGGFGQLPVPGWSLGFLMGALDAISLAALWVIAAYARGSALARPSTVVPLAAATTFAAVSLTYFLGRSHPNNLTHVAPPFVVMLTLWTALAWRAWVSERIPAAAAVVALATVCVALLIAQQTPLLRDKAPDSALAAAVGVFTGRAELLQRIRALVDLPVISPQTPVVEALVRTHVPRGAPVLIAVDPGVATETLIRLDRSDAIPIGTPEQDGLLGARRDALVRAARGLPCGTFVVTQNASMGAGAGQWLLAAVVKALRSRHPFHQVAAASGYRVFRMGCGPS